MSLTTKFNKAKRMGIEFIDGYKPTDEEELDKLIETKQSLLDQQKQEDKIRRAQEKKADDDAKKTRVILQDVDGDDVDQAEYFFPRLVKQVINEKTPNERVFEPTDQTAPIYFNKTYGLPVDRDELIDEFVKYFPRKKGFLFYKLRDKEVYLVIVPLKYARTVSASNESLPGDFQKHALSFIQEGSVGLDSLRIKLERIQKHHSISTEAIAQ